MCAPGTFQEVILHAMRFPSCQRIAYSTCSVHEQENEEVVQDVPQKPNLDFSSCVDASWIRFYQVVSVRSSLVAFASLSPGVVHQDR